MRLLIPSRAASVCAVLSFIQPGALLKGGVCMSVCPAHLPPSRNGATISPGPTHPWACDLGEALGQGAGCSADEGQGDSKLSHQSSSPGTLNSFVKRILTIHIQKSKVTFEVFHILRLKGKRTCYRDTVTEKDPMGPSRDRPLP